MWWELQTPERQKQVRQLVKEGRLEFANGGWSMHDEASPHYDDMINNMMIGLQWLEQVLETRPRVGWSIDPFGHSSANPRLLADMGMDAWVFARVDFQDLEQRREDKTLQFVWKPMLESLGDSVEIFTHILEDHYHWPSFFKDGYEADFNDY